MSTKQPVPALPCNNGGGIIWRQDNWFQRPDCGALSTEYGGLFTGQEPVLDFVKVVNAIRNSKAKNK